VGVLNVYAPLSPYDRIQLWSSIETTLPTNIRCILIGDWNRVIQAKDNSHTDSKIAGTVEQLAFAWMTSHLGVEDFFQATNQLQFIWDNRRRVGIHKLKRLLFPQLDRLSISLHSAIQYLWRLHHIRSSPSPALPQNLAGNLYKLSL
jgi:hypothetical protein